MEYIFIPVLRTAIAYIVLLILSRIMGRKMISQMTFFDFVVGITIGSVAANLALGPFNSITAGLTVLVSLTILVLIIDYLHIGSFKARKLIRSEPLTLINKGKIVQENMRKERLSLDELTMMLREKNVFNIADVEFAIMESDGKLSVQKKSNKQPLTPFDINIWTPYKGLTNDIIIDGNLLEENINKANIKRDLIMEQLKMYGVGDISEVFYAGMDSSNMLYVSKKSKDSEEHGKYGIE